MEKSFEILLRIYNGITDQKFFRICVLVSIPLGYSQIIEALNISNRTLSSVSYGIDNLERESDETNEEIFRTRIGINSEIEEIRSMLGEIRRDTQGIDRNTNRIPY